jgi:mucolipin
MSNSNKKSSNSMTSSSESIDNNKSVKFSSDDNNSNNSLIINSDNTSNNDLDIDTNKISTRDDIDSKVPSNIANNIAKRMRKTSHQNFDSKPNSRSHSLKEESNVNETDNSIEQNSYQEMNSLVTQTQNQYTPHMRDKMQRKLRYYFMSPIDKWKAKRRFPFKLLIQLIKIILVTAQLMIFGFDMSSYLSQEGNMIVSFREIFLTNWDPVREVMAYPPAAGPYAIYTKEDFYSSVDYAIRQFSNISDMTIGSFGYAINTSDTNRNMSDITIRRQRYAMGDAQPSDYVYIYDNEIVNDKLIIGELYPPNDQRWFTHFSAFDYFNKHNFSLNFDRLLLIELILPLRTIYLNSLAKYDAPKCYDVNVSIVYDNTEHDGQMIVSLNAYQKRHDCDGNLSDSEDSDSEKVKRQLLNWLVIIFCFISFILCVRSLFKGQTLRKETQSFFNRFLRKSLTFHEKMDFIDLWIVMIIINDLMILTASILKMQMETQAIENSLYNTCSILLGVGNLFVWAGILRYLGFFHKYNILILTLRRAIPHVLRFTLCAILLYGY